MLCTARLTFGDDAVREWTFNQDYDAGFTSRHTHQLAGLWMSQFDYDDE